MANPTMNPERPGYTDPERPGYGKSTNWWIAAAIAIVALVAIFGLGFGSRHKDATTAPLNTTGQGRRPIDDSVRPRVSPTQTVPAPADPNLAPAEPTTPPNDAPKTLPPDTTPAPTTPIDTETR